MWRLFNYERRHQAPASRKVFVHRLTRHAVASLATVAISLAVGSAGYMHFEQMKPIDAFINASMILSGMGPVSTLTTTGGKLFASFYAIASGLLLFAVAGLMLAPVYHRILHRFHVEDTEDSPAGSGSEASPDAARGPSGKPPPAAAAPRARPKGRSR
jgi:hypothetical protein